MKVSIITPSFNQAKYLDATLQSVLSQDYRDIELLVFDGGSNDGSVDILKRQTDERLRWISRKDKGQTDAINQGLYASKGEIVAYLNSDDVYYPDAIRTAADYFLSHPECEILYGEAHHLHEDGSVMEEYYCEPWNYERLLKVCFICQPAVFWRRSVQQRFGFFDETLNYGMDYDYWLRVGKHIPFHFLKGRFLAGSRLHADTKTLSKRVDVHREIFRVVARHAAQSEPIEHWFRHFLHYRALRGAAQVGSAALWQRRHLERFVIGAIAESNREGIELSTAFCEELSQKLAILEGAQ